MVNNESVSQANVNVGGVAVLIGVVVMGCVGCWVLLEESVQARAKDSMNKQ